MNAQSDVLAADRRFFAALIAADTQALDRGSAQQRFDETEIGAYLARAIFDEKKRVAVVFGNRGDNGGNAESGRNAWKSRSAPRPRTRG